MPTLHIACSASTILSAASNSSVVIFLLSLLKSEADAERRKKEGSKARSLREEAKILELEKEY